MNYASLVVSSKQVNARGMGASVSCEAPLPSVRTGGGHRRDDTARALLKKARDQRMDRPWGGW